MLSFVRLFCIKQPSQFLSSLRQSHHSFFDVSENSLMLAEEFIDQYIPFLYCSLITSITELCLPEVRTKFSSVKNITASITKEKEKRGEKEQKREYYNRILHLKLQVCGNKVNTDKLPWKKPNFRKHRFLTPHF